MARTRRPGVGVGMVTDDALYSPDWFRVSALVLRLRPTVRIARQRMRGEVWYVYRDEASGRQLRLNLAAHRFAGRLDGRLSVHVLWDQLLDHDGDDAPSQHDIVAIVQQLADTGVVAVEHGADLARLSRREAERNRHKLLASVNPLSFKVPLLDPGRLLERTWRWVAPLYTPWAFAAIVLVALFAAGVAFEHRDALTAYAQARVPTPGFALALWLVYPLLKGLHEMAHAWAVRVWGGRVPEMGVTLLMGMPVPYVDASGAALFASRARRVAVSLAGIAAELMVAAAALWLWLSVEDGPLRTAAFAAMTIGAVSTVFVNGNPLMRFDAYFALSDAIGIPNLAERSRQAWAALARRVIAGDPGGARPAGSAGDWAWLLGWGLGSWIYRVGVFVWLATWLAPWSKWAAIAVLAWGGWLVAGRAAWGTLRYITQAPWQTERPVRAVAGVGFAVAALAAVLGTVPLPDATTLPGVVVPADDATLRATEGGRVAEVRVRAGDRVAAGDMLVRLENDALLTELARMRAMREAHEAERIRVLESDRAASGVAQDEIDRTIARIAELERRLGSLTLRAAADGVVTFVDADGPIGRQVR
ncbi:MAG: biotin/lipoyl-binding protein, partial [Burkholderiaceae bacterium]